MNLLFMSNGLAPYGIPRNGLIALYDPGRQILTGTTGQTLIDYTGRGNNAQLGSAAGADTNDPAFSGAGLVFGADDYCMSDSPVFDDMLQFTCITVCKPLSAGGGNGGRLWDKTKIIASIADKFRLLIARTTGSDTWEGSVVNYNNAFVHSVRLNRNTPDTAPVVNINNTQQILTRIATGSGIIPSDATSDLYIGNNPTGVRNFDGSLYAQLWYNRVLSDAEYMQAYNGLHRLMLSRGVVI